jgi:hypothetical protein
MIGSGSAYERLLDRLRDNGQKVRELSPEHAEVQCPAHEDSKASLGLRRGRDGALAICRAVCHYNDVIAALELSDTDLFDDPRSDVRLRRQLREAGADSNTDPE